MPKKCSSFEFCVERSMEYAKNGDYNKACTSFFSDVRKSKCTKCIMEYAFIYMAILKDSSTDEETFEKALRGFSINCICE
jgi:hypothetical protein